ncbi:MAG: trypsin-like peptidase domain-containing protein [Dermatophilaceae bacterium]
MSNPQSNPQWYTPRGGATMAPPAGGDSPTASLPATPPPADRAGIPPYSPYQPSAPAPPHGPSDPTGPTGHPGPRPASGRRRTAELTAVAVLAAILSSGGTVAAAQLWGTETQNPSAASSGSTLGRGADTAPVTQANGSAPDWSATAAAVSPSVVAIAASSGRAGGEGSGVVIDDRGHIVTNNHVVAGSREITVTLSDGRTYPATITGTDPSTDLAVLSVADAPDDLRPIALGDSEALEVGAPVMAVGNPLGLAGTVTTGIVSALDRPVTTQGEGQQDGPPGGGSSAEPVVTNAIQTSAAINPGNSGGALVNASGQLVGINSSIATLGSSGQSGNIGIGFAIPVNEVRSISEQLIADGSASHAYLGVTPEDGTADDGTATRAGARVASVEAGTPAEEAGLQVGDVVVAVDDERVDSAESLIAQIRERSAEERVTLTVIRDGRSSEIQATLAVREE